MRRLKNSLLLATGLLAASLVLWTPSTALANPGDNSGSEGRADGSQPGYAETWVMVHAPTSLWSHSEATGEVLDDLIPRRYLRVEAPQQGSRLWVWDPAYDQFGYVEAEAVGPAHPPEVHPHPPFEGRWIEVNQSLPQTITAYVGDLPVFNAPIVAGLRGTPTGTFRIYRRVYNETMDSRTVPVSDFYYLTNVLFTQYFYGAMALHLNYWFPPERFGRPGSHGCIGMGYDDAKFFWEWAEIGTPVLVRY